jgi:hypothetical protein
MDTSGLSKEIQRLAHSYGVYKAKLDTIDIKVNIARERVNIHFQKSLSKLNPKGKGYTKKRIRLNLIKEKRLKAIDKYSKVGKQNLINKVKELKSKLIEETEKELLKAEKKTMNKSSLPVIKNVTKTTYKKVPKKISGLKKTLISTFIASIIVSAYTIAKKAEQKRNEKLRKNR